VAHELHHNLHGAQHESAHEEGHEGVLVPQCPSEQGHAEEQPQHLRIEEPAFGCDAHKEEGGDASPVQGPHGDEVKGRPDEVSPEKAGADIIQGEGAVVWQPILDEGEEAGEQITGQGAGQGEGDFLEPGDGGFRRG